jgi:hypothetical protein
MNHGKFQDLPISRMVLGTRSEKLCAGHQRHGSGEEIVTGGSDITGNHAQSKTFNNF